MKRQDFNQGWAFGKQGAEMTAVTLPHDAMIHEKRNKDASDSGHGFFPGGQYIYEKTFTAPKDWIAKTVRIDFEGIYRNSIISLNGQSLGGCRYGYVPFSVCLDTALRYGEENTLRVDVDNSELPNSRWYTGSGIYRPVHLLVAEKEHIQCVKIKTESYSPARVRVEVSAGAGDITVELLDGETVVATTGNREDELLIPNAKLWSDTSPNLYRYRAVLRNRRKILDIAEGTFGIRLIEWSNKGFFINGNETLLRGGCLHHDNGILGAATYAESDERRVRLLKEAGFNAIRSSHNPASEAMIRACDQYGIYLIDETWDMWYNKKSRYDYASDFEENWQFDIRAMVERDYNHPSVVLYSIGNEVSEPAHQKGIEMTQRLVDFVHSLDHTRPVTAGFNLMIISRSAAGNAIYKENGGRDDEGQQKAVSGMSSTMYNMIASMIGPNMNKGANSKKADAISSPSIDLLDIAGYNYASGRYPLEEKAHPSRIIFGSETFPQDIWKNWQMVKKYPYLIGDFMWTAWDYLGECGLGAWAYTEDGKRFDKPYPWIAAEAGVFDMNGTPNGELYLAKAAWEQLPSPVICVQPVNHPGTAPAKSTWRGTNSVQSWAWQGCDGNGAVVEVYANGGIVELILNKRSLGRKKIKNGKAEFKTKYSSGVLEAVQFDAHGSPINKAELHSAVGPLGLLVRPEKSEVRPGEVFYVPVKVIGSNGVTESNGDKEVSVTITGGELLAFGSANPRTEDRYDAGRCTTYYGEAMVVIRAGNGGKVIVTVTDEINIASAEVEISK